MINGKKLVALCTSRVYDPQIHGYIERLNKKLRAEDCSLLVFAINSDIYWEEDRQAAERYVFNLLPYDSLDAVIIMDEKIKSHKIANKILDASHKHNVPVIIADGTYEGASCITFDYEKGFEQIVRHVIEDHHIKHPLIMAGQPDNDFSNSRIEVFKNVLKENGIDFNDSMISYGYFWADPCKLAMTEVLKRESLPDAIICANDIMAITVSEMLLDAGYRIPEDVLVSGFDGYDGIYFNSPKISSVSCDIIHLAEATLEVVLEAIKDKGVHDRSIVPVLIPNESCGCPEHSEHPQLLSNWFKESFARTNDDNRVLKRLSAFMQTSSSPGEMVSHLNCYKTCDTLVVVDRKIFDIESNYFTDAELDKKKKDLVPIFDYDNTEKYENSAFELPEESDDSTEDVLTPATRDRILELTESGYPLIFNALDFMGKPFGFVCYYFNDNLISNYTNTINATNAIGTGIGGYVIIQYQKALREQMDEMYLRDSLTGLYNRIGFKEEFDKILENKKYENTKITVIMSDMDGLKYINDNYGHAEGDNAIFMVAKAISESVPENSLSTRIGGDELFSVVIGDADIDSVIENISKYLRKYNAKSGKPYRISTSCGYVQGVLNKDFDIAEAMKIADKMMYVEKTKKHLPYRSRASRDVLSKGRSRSK